MSGRVALVWDPAYTAYDFGPQHPLRPVRVELAVELARACGLVDAPNVEVLLPRPATRAELETVHVGGYVDAVEGISADPRGPFEEYGWGIGTEWLPSGLPRRDCPAFAEMHEASALVVGGSILAAERVWTGGAEHSFNPAGGLHHAMADRASGFCIYNDPAIAIRWLLDHGAARVAYVDVDVHHGDGVQAAFYDDPRVLTISLHETGAFLFPGTGFPEEVGGGDAAGLSVNVALPPYTHDDAYRAAFERIVPPLVESFRADVLVTQLGCDTHATDPLAHLALTTRAYRWVYGALHSLAHEHAGGRWVSTGGGGYQLFTVVPRAWTLAFAEMSGGSLPDRIPDAWVEVARARGAPRVPEGFEDPQVAMPAGRYEEATERARASAEATARAVFPYHGLAG